MSSVVNLNKTAYAFYVVNYSYVYCVETAILRE